MRWWWLAIALVGACKRVDSSGPPSARRLATACIKSSACGPPTVTECLESAYHIDADVSVYRPQAISCLANGGADCAALLECVEDHCPDNFCEAGTCDGPYAACNGTEIVRCDFDQIRRVDDCSAYGQTCKNHPLGGLYCGDVGALPCSGSRCEDDTLIDCSSGEEHEIECGLLYWDGICSELQQRCAYGDTCGTDQPPTCIGDVLRVCALGAIVDVDCKQIGFARCSNGACFAY